MVKVNCTAIALVGVVIKMSASVTCFSVVVDSELKFVSHVMCLAGQYFYHYVSFVPSVAA